MVPNIPGFFLSSFESVDNFRVRIGTAIGCDTTLEVSGLSMGDGAMDDGVFSISGSFVRPGKGSRADRTGAGVNTGAEIGARESGAGGRDGKGCVENEVGGIGCEYLRGEGGFCTAGDADVVGKDATR